MSEAVAIETGFRRYDHVERLGHDDVDGLLVGITYVFPKLDGTNASVWMDGDALGCGSRNRTITVEADNQGFAAHVAENSARFNALLSGRPWIVYGEWLIPHTLKTYREEAWRKFWIFDVYDRERHAYIPYAEYEPILTALGFDVIMPLCTIENPSSEQVQAQVETNTYLVMDGAGVGEGIVVKNYAWRNAFGRQPWAKVVRNEFKEQNALKFGTTHKTGEFVVEWAIAQEFCTPTLVGKTRAKVVADVASAHGIDLATDPNGQQRVEATHRSAVIPQLLGRVFHDLVQEELWGALKKHRNPKIDFKLLNQHATAKVKEYAKDLF